MRLLIAFITGVILLFIMASQMANDNQSAFLIKQLDEMEDMIPNRDRINTEVSQVDVAWHIDHMLKVINGIYDSLEVSDPNKYQLSINPLRTLVFTSGKMRRGVGQSPKSVLPPEEILTDSLYHQLEQARAKAHKISQLGPKVNFNHFAFGQLDRDGAMRFIEIHTNHHIDIIRDILVAN